MVWEALLSTTNSPIPPPFPFQPLKNSFFPWPNFLFLSLHQTIYTMLVTIGAIVLAVVCVIAYFAGFYKKEPGDTREGETIP